MVTRGSPKPLLRVRVLLPLPNESLENIEFSGLSSLLEQRFTPAHTPTRSLFDQRANVLLHSPRVIALHLLADVSVYVHRKGG